MIKQIGNMEREVGFHLHMDATEELPESYRQVLKSNGFHEDHFDGVPTKCTNSPPLEHWTKLYAPRGVDLVKSDMKELAKQADYHGVAGYLEAEVISKEYLGGTYDSNISGTVDPFPYLLGTRALSDKEAFKKRELHVEMKRDSNPNLIEAFLDARFMGIYWEDEVIFTAQGVDKAIDTLEVTVIGYLNRQGGARDCHVLVEIMPPWAYSYHKVDKNDQPPVIYELTSV